MNQAAIVVNEGVSNLAGMAILILVVAMVGSWLFRALLLRRLRIRHPEEFAGLGYPSSRQLASLSPRLQELHIKFWWYLWGGKAFQVNDKLVTGLARVVQISDIALVGSALALFWAVWK